MATRKSPNDVAAPVPPENEPGHHPPVEQDKPVRRFRALADELASEAATTRFPFAFEARLVPAALAVGVTPRTAWVDVGGGELEVRFGLWRLCTPLENIAGAETTGPYSFWKVVGPARLSFADRGVTMATTTAGGVCIRFKEPVPGIIPALLPGRGLLRHPAVTVTVQDPGGLAKRLHRDVGS